MLLLDEPFGALDAKVRAELREWLRRLHDEVHVTTLLVTHDQEEAMSIADNIAVMDNAHIEQVGGPRELYDRPANQLRDGLPRPGRALDRTLVRPHDIAITAVPTRRPRGAGARVSHLGFEVRVELVLPEGEPVFAQLTRTEAESSTSRGDIVWLRTAGGTRSRPSSVQESSCAGSGSRRWGYSTTRERLPSCGLENRRPSRSLPGTAHCYACDGAGA